ncbi:MAG: hypothetical protein GY751_17405 [Bacteroidetes bacterium]|nr:hypothetical protein [Bacteroidota bacterium]
MLVKLPSPDLEMDDLTGPMDLSGRFTCKTPSEDLTGLGYLSGRTLNDCIVNTVYYYIKNIQVRPFRLPIKLI